MYMYTFPPLTTFVRHDCYQHNAQVVHVFKSLAGWPKQQVSGSGRCSTGWGLAQRVGICPRKNRGPTCINHGSFEGSFVQLFSEQRKQNSWQIFRTSLVFKTPSYDCHWHLETLFMACSITKEIMFSYVFMGQVTAYPNAWCFIIIMCLYMYIIGVGISSRKWSCLCTVWDHFSI